MRKYVIAFVFCLAVLVAFAPARVFADEIEYDNTFVKITSSGDEVYNMNVVSGSDVYYFKSYDSDGKYMFQAATLSKNLDITYSPSFTRYTRNCYMLNSDGNKVVASNFIDGFGYVPLYQSEVVFVGASEGQYEISRYIEIPYDAELGRSDERILRFMLEGDSTGFDFSNWSGIYDSGIGVLKDVSMRLAYPDGAGNVDRVLSRFYYSSKTTKGYDVESEGTKIRLYESVTYYKRSDDSVYSEGPKILVGMFDATKLQITYNVNDAFRITTESTDSQYIVSPWTIVSKQLVRNDRIYLQVVDSSGNYGNYLRIGGQSDNGNKHPQDAVDEDGNIVSSEDGGYSNEDTDTKVGTSDDGSVESAFNDANLKPDPSISIGSVDDAMDVTKDMLSLIGNIPIAIRKLFSFLPSWCLNYVAIVFVALGILIIYKLIRG